MPELALAFIIQNFEIWTVRSTFHLPTQLCYCVMCIYTDSINESIEYVHDFFGSLCLC
jgi:hypothetical protein